MYIRRSVVKLAQQEPEIKLPKTISSIRQIAIPQALCDILQELKKEQDRKKALLGEKWHEEGFLFTDWCGHVMHPHTPTKQFDKFLKKYGFRHLKFHGLRHSSATYLLSNGCDIKTVSKRLGHTSIDTTNMMRAVKETFPRAMFFGFTGTPIQIENTKKGCTTADVFGNELHRYSIADGIRDKNVLGFDPSKVLTYKEKEAREAVALEQAKANSVSEVFDSPAKQKVYYYYMKDAPMAGYTDETGKRVRGIEEFLLESGQYRTEEHRKTVIQDIRENWLSISHNYKFHGLLATSSIPEAVEYYRLFKKLVPEIKVTALFDPNIDNNGKGIEKEDALKEIIEDYNARYKQTFAIPTYAKMKKDIQYRLAHKKPYERIAYSPNDQIDLLIVVDQMLTGYDSKWLNVLYLDKILRYENIIQAFSRTNRLFGEDKPFGTIKYYRAPFTMEQNIKDAVKLYSGDKPLGMFVCKLDKNIEGMNAVFTQIKNLFEAADVANFEKLPGSIEERKKFAKLFREFNSYLESAKVQGFIWECPEYNIINEETGEVITVSPLMDYRTYRILVLRYKELSSPSSDNSPSGEDLPYRTSADHAYARRSARQHSIWRYTPVFSREGHKVQSVP